MYRMLQKKLTYKSYYRVSCFLLEFLKRVWTLSASNDYTFGQFWMLNMFRRHGNLILLAIRLPPAAFCSLFGGGRYKSCRMNKNYKWDRHTHGTDTHTGQTHTHGTDTQTYGTDTQTWDRHTLVKFMLKLQSLITSKVFFTAAPVPGESVEVLSFEIGLEMEAWRVFGQTNRQTEWQKPFFIKYIDTRRVGKKYKNKWRL